MTPHVSISLLRTQTDERLVELIAAGHDRAFDAIVDRYRRPLLRYAHRFLKEDGRAEDVVQAALVSAWTALREGTTVRDLRPWLYRIVHNGALNAMKKPGSDDAPLIEASDTRLGPEAAVEQREDVRRALDTIASLPDRQRAALLAVALEGRSHAAVGEDLGINDTAVRQLVRRARASLRVAATAVTPWPVAVWMAGIGGPQAIDSATRVGEVVGGVGAGTLFGGSAMKAGALIAATGALAVSAPQVAHITGHPGRSAPASAEAAQSGRDAGVSAGGGSGSTAGALNATGLIRTSPLPAGQGPTTDSSGRSRTGHGRGSDDHRSGAGVQTPGPGSGSGPSGTSGGDDGAEDQPSADHHGVTEEPSHRQGRRRSEGDRHSGSDDGREQHRPESDDAAAPEGDRTSGSGTSGSEESSGSSELERPRETTTAGSEQQAPEPQKVESEDRHSSGGSDNPPQAAPTQP